MRRLVPFLAGIAVLGIVIVGLIQASGGKEEDLPPFHLNEALTSLNGAPAPLAALHDQHSQLLEGGTRAFRARVKELRGHPVVVNKWGSWCNPCRQEFPLFQHVGADFGKRVAFLGIDVLDNAQEATTFLGRFPLTYPSYRDPRGTISQAIGIAGGAPITLFLDGRGKTAFIHQGQYKNRADLERDIRRYLHA